MHKPVLAMIKNNEKTKEYFFEEGCYITELWNENTDDDVSIARARLAAGETTRNHALRDTIERYLILYGEGIVYVGDDEPRKVQQNDVVLIPAATSQYIKNTGNSDLLFLAICTPRFKAENYLALQD